MQYPRYIKKFGDILVAFTLKNVKGNILKYSVPLLWKRETNSIFYLEIVFKHFLKHKLIEEHMKRFIKKSTNLVLTFTVILMGMFFNTIPTTAFAEKVSFISITGIENPFAQGFSLYEADVGSVRAKPTLVDIDGDGDFDFFSGNSTGTFNYYENTGDNSNPDFVERTGTDNPLDSMDAGDWSAPAFVDIDGDNDFDLFSGNTEGTFKYYENAGCSLSAVFVERTGADNPSVLED